MFRDCKSGGYNLESTKANQQRLTNLILLIALAYTASCLTGLNIRQSGVQEYINRLKIEGKNRPRHSYFWTGLYGSTWRLAIDLCWEWVEKLMGLSPNKLAFYRRGLRAMKLIQTAVKLGVVTPPALLQCFWFNISFFFVERFLLYRRTYLK